MKQYFSVFTRRHMALNIFLCLTVVLVTLPVAASAGKETHTAGDLISLSVRDEPLGDVLKKVSMATGYEITLDNEWQNYRVTASLDAMPLHKGLKQILRNLNNVIIYGSGRTIQIIIYDKTAPEGVSSNQKPSSDETDISGQKSETGPSNIEGKEKTTSRELSIETDAAATTDAQEQSAGESTEQDTQAESKSDEETENSEDDKRTDDTM